MQQTGCLKKRRKRNIAKVNGLSLAEYDEDGDTYRGLDIYQSDNFTSRSSEFHDARREKRPSYTRVTRDPSYNSTIDPELGDLDGDWWNGMVSRPDSGDLKKTQSAIDRPYLLDKTVCLRLKQLLLLGSTSGAFPWIWSRKKHKIEKWSPRWEKFWVTFWFFFTIQTTFILSFQFYSFYMRVKEDTKTYREVFMNFFSVYWYVCAVYFNINMFIYKDAIRQYVNTMFALNKALCEKYLLDIEGYKDGGRILISLSIPCNCSQVFASVALFLVMPYQPWYLYSYVYKPTNPWYWLIPGAIQEFGMAGQVITGYMFTTWIVVAHCNTVDFWLKEIHKNNDSSYTIPSLRNPKVAIEVYRSLQILCNVFNDCMSPLAIPLVKLHISTGIIPCGYVLIRSMNHLFVEEFPGILTYPIGVIDCATGAFALLSMAAEMFDLGCGFIDSWSKTRQKDFRRILQSLPTLKVKIGSLYHVTVSTTLTFFKTTTDYIIHCIVTFP